MAATDRRKKPDRRDSPAAMIVPAALGSDDAAKELVNWLFPVYVTLIVLSIFALRSTVSVAGGHELPLDRAVLTAVNAATLTGFPQSIKADWFKPFGQILILVLTLAGSAFSLIAGGLAVRRILRLPYTDKQILKAVAICEGAALLLGAVNLCGTGTNFIGSLTQGAAAFGNSGMAMGHPYDLTAWQIHLVMLPMAFLGGLGITVLVELFNLLFHGKRMSTHARTALAVSIGLYVISVLVFLLVRGKNGDFSTAVGGGTEVLSSSSAAAINARTAGFNFETSHAWPRAMQWIVIVLMMIGASPGGTGGGIKTTTLASLFGGARKSLRGQIAGRAFGIALTWVTIYLAFALIGVVMLMFVEPQTAADRLVFLSFSALSNVGLAPDMLAVTAGGSYVLAAIMLAGRMTPLLILWWMADTTEDAELAIG